MNMKLDAESYLKSGSNELRILEYRMTDVSYGINILKVNKIVSGVTTFTQVPESHSAISGMFEDMGRLIPVVDLANLLGVGNETARRGKVIVTEFFGLLTGFWVDRIDWIHHFKWEDVIDAQSVFSNINQRYVIGIVKPTEERMVLMLDYETILLDLCPHIRTENTVVADHREDFSQKKILVAEDSPAVRAMLVNEMLELGCEVYEASDGAQAWETFQQHEFDLVICDVEMPQMDGLAVTLNIRQSKRSDTPVIIYSSIGDIGMKARAAYLKADAHITKLNLDKLLDTAGKLMRGEKINQEELDSDQTEPVPLELVTSE